MKKALLALAVAGAAVSAQADVKLSGHVNYVAGDLEDLQTQVNNGALEASNTNFTVDDADTSVSRFRIIATKKAGDITYGLREEFGLDGNDDADVSIRFNELWIKGGFGKVSLGQGSESSDGGAENDFSGTYLINGDLDSWNSAGEFSFTTVDGGRTERLKYDSPKIGGLATVSIDYQSDDDVVGGITLGQSNWAASLYHESRDANDSDETGGSFAVKAGGFSLAYQFADRDAQNSAAATTANSLGEELEYRAIIIGYKVGAFSFALDRQTNEVTGVALDASTTPEVTSTGFGFVYRPTKGVELYSAVRKFEADITSQATQVATNTTSFDGTGILIGGRIKF